MNWHRQELMNLQDIIELELRVAIKRQVEKIERESLWTNLKEVLSSLLEC